MARTVRDAKLETRTARAALKPSGKPYFRAIDEGLHLGYRKGQTAGKWVDAPLCRRAVLHHGDDRDGRRHDRPRRQRRSCRSPRPRPSPVSVSLRVSAGAGQPPQPGPTPSRTRSSDYLAWMEQNRKSGRDTRWRAEALILPALGGTTAAS